MEMVIDMHRGPNLSPRVQGPGTPNIISACAHAPHQRATRHMRQPNNYYLRLCDIIMNANSPINVQRQLSLY